MNVSLIFGFRNRDLIVPTTRSTVAVTIHEATSQRDGVDFWQQQAILSTHSPIRYRSQELPNHPEDGLVRLWQ